MGTWAVTRAIVFTAIAIAAPHGFLVALGNGDGTWYLEVLRHGYTVGPDGYAHSVAFFPLFPLIARVVVRAGIAWPLAGALVNNVAFLLAVLLLYRYTRDTFDTATARWSVAVACALPLSLFCSVAYAEGLFMLFSVVALAWYRRKMYLGAGLAAAAASATRPLGVALALGLVIAALVERRSARAVFSCALGLLGIVAFSLYCWAHLHDPLAFVHVQKFWRHGSGFDTPAWFAVLTTAVHGSAHSWITIAFLVVAAPCVLIFRERIGVAGVSYVLLSVVAIAISGAPFSVDRLLYATVPLLIALGAFFRRVPPLGYGAIAASLVLLFIDAMTFAQFRWVA
ncbi:MAG TPA: mannosyltransferase family protein [Candidatus Baltobacteraceae bacterium]|nr:mannosyltransferase family protein [Candidatus Baltobacteraceae bacterium]